MSALIDRSRPAGFPFGAGFADPVHGAQQAFRTLLAAMSYAGRVQALPPAALDGLQPADAELAPPLPPGLAALLLTLLDAQTPALLAGGLADAAPWLRFHTGARALRDGEPATLAAARAADVDAAVAHDAARDRRIAEVEAVAAVADARAQHRHPDFRRPQPQEGIIRDAARETLQQGSRRVRQDGQPALPSGACRHSIDGIRRVWGHGDVI